MDKLLERRRAMRHINSETIMAFYDNELSAKEAAVVQAHIASRPGCQAELESFRKTGLMISRLPAGRNIIAPPFAVIKARALADRKRGRWDKWHMRLHNSVRPLIATAVALIVFLTAFFLSEKQSRSSDPFKDETCMIEQETDAIVQGYDSLPQYYR